MDILENYHLFAQRVAAAMNKAKIKPLTDRLHAVMVIIAADSQPVVGAIEYEDGVWTTQVKLLEVTRDSAGD